MNLTKTFKFMGMTVSVETVGGDDIIYVKSGDPILAYAPWYAQKVDGYEFGVVKSANSTGSGGQVKFKVDDRVDGWVGDSYWIGPTHTLVTFDSPVRRRAIVELPYLTYGADREWVMFPTPHSTSKYAVNGKVRTTINPVHSAAMLSGKIIYATITSKTEVAVCNDVDSPAVVDLSGILDDEYRPPDGDSSSFAQTITMAVTGDMKFSADGKKLFVAMRGDSGDKYVAFQSARPLYIAEIDVVTAQRVGIHKFPGSVTYGSTAVVTAVVAWGIPKAAPYTPVAATVTVTETDIRSNDSSLSTTPMPGHEDEGWLNLSNTNTQSSTATASVSLAIGGEVVFSSAVVSGTNTKTTTTTGTGYYDVDSGELIWWTSSSTIMETLAVRNLLLHIRDIDVANRTALIRLSEEAIDQELPAGVQIVGNLTMTDVAIAHGQEIFRKVSNATGHSLWYSHSGESASSSTMDQTSRGATAKFMHDHSIHRGGCIQVLKNNDVYFTVYTEMLRNQFVVFGAIEPSPSIFDDPSDYRSSYWVRDGEVYRHMMRDWTPQNDPGEKFLKGGELWFTEFDSKNDVYLPAVKMNDYTAVSDDGEFMYGRLSMTLPGKHKAQKDHP